VVVPVPPLAIDKVPVVPATIGRLVASVKSKAGVASEPPRETDTPPNETEEFTKSEFAIEPTRFNFEYAIAAAELMSAFTMVSSVISDETIEVPKSAVTLPPEYVRPPEKVVVEVHVGTPPTRASTCPFVPALVVAILEVPLPKRTVFACRFAQPVPPFATASMEEPTSFTKSIVAVVTAPAVALRKPDKEPIERPSDAIWTPAKVEVADVFMRAVSTPPTKVDVAEVVPVKEPASAFVPKSDAPRTESARHGDVVPMPTEPARYAVVVFGSNQYSADVVAFEPIATMSSKFPE
jgi:hypothetical protein